VSFIGRILPITRFLDVEALLDGIGRVVENSDGSSLGKLKMRGMILKEVPKFVDKPKAPDGLNITKLILSVLWNGTRESLIEFQNKSLFIGVTLMHSQDASNMDLERLQICSVHYTTPNGRIIPFCAYNALYRQEVEDRFSVQRDEIKKIKELNPTAKS